ncbi:hypothetical protein [Geomonas propionica]|uniref:Chemotaxis methyl-accepting receptor HlyB-like 4HB MCP domain-containing protein n=1 Tax=Geomonas propionica TaxID=2798582 RepID=A0ABS0YVW9_9BACT|nr:hypothetical protein [Geomonas propionica]MBJ6802069.1 hypothetical protein [Geomonas propionica]
MNKAKYVLMLMLVIGLYGAVSKYNSSQYLDNSKQAYKHISQNLVICGKMLSEYSILLEASGYMSPQTLDSMFLSVYEKSYGNHSEKIKLLNSKKLQDTMGKLKNPPEKYKMFYSKLIAYYGEYSKLEKLVATAQGSEIRSSIRDINQSIVEVETLERQLDVMLK